MAVVLSGAVLVSGAAVPVVLFLSRGMRVLVGVTVPVRMAVRGAILMGVLVRVLVFVLVRVVGHGRLRTRGEPDGTGARRRGRARGQVGGYGPGPSRCAPESGDPESCGAWPSG